MTSAGNMSDGHQKWFVWEDNRFCIAPLGVVYEDGCERALVAAQKAFPGLPLKVWENRVMRTFQSRVDFFFDHAPYAYSPAMQSEFAGCLCCAMDLAAAEIWAERNPVHFEWTADNSGTGSAPQYECGLYPLADDNQLGEVLESLSGIDTDEGPYRRVVQASLAYMAMMQSAYDVSAPSANDAGVPSISGADISGMCQVQNCIHPCAEGSSRCKIEHF